MSQPSDVIGAGVTNQAVVVRFKDPEQVMLARGGRAGMVAYQFAPKALEDYAYNKLKQKIIDGAQAEGTDLQVTIAAPPTGKRSVPDLLVGAGALGAGLLLWKYVIRGLILKR